MEKLLDELRQQALQSETRRHFLQTCSTGLGAFALQFLLGGCGAQGPKGRQAAAALVAPGDPMTPRPAQFVPKAKRVIYIHLAGSPSQLELFDYKPELKKYHGKDCPQELLAGKKFAFIRGTPKMLGPQGQFAQHGQSGAWVSDYLPHLQGVADELTFLKAMYTDQFNHAPAQLLMHTGSARLGRPSIGSWVTYGLGSENDDLPGFIVLASGGKQPDAGKSVWGSGFLPSVYQGVQCRTDGDPVLYVSNPQGMNRDIRRKTIDAINQINRQQYDSVRDPEVLTRISQYEMAFRMQMSVPDAMDIQGEPESITKMYGVDPNKGSFARNCLLARRLVERGVRFVQLFDWGWDTHGTSKDGSIEVGLRDKCKESDRAVAALIKDLKQRGLLDETLVVWGGEFGRTPMQENRDGQTLPFMGRDHHLEAFTVWMAGAGLKKGFSFGETDEIGYYGVKDKVHVHDLQATILHLLGFDHEKLTYPFQGRPFRLTDVAGKVVKEVLV
ncbi:MAG TPA: DUF1501 domain-containing protein [Cytophagales bacterium]